MATSGRVIAWYVALGALILGGIGAWRWSVNTENDNRREGQYGSIPRSGYHDPAATIATVDAAPQANYWCSTGACFRTRTECEDYRDGMSIATDLCAPQEIAYCYRNNVKTMCDRTLDDCNHLRNVAVDQADIGHDLYPRTACRAEP